MLWRFLRRILQPLDRVGTTYSNQVSIQHDSTQRCKDILIMHTPEPLAIERTDRKRIFLMPLPEYRFYADAAKIEDLVDWKTICHGRGRCLEVLRE